MKEDEKKRILCSLFLVCRSLNESHSSVFGAHGIYSRCMYGSLSVCTYVLNLQPLMSGDERPHLHVCAIAIVTSPIFVYVRTLFGRWCVCVFLCCCSFSSSSLQKIEKKMHSGISATNKSTLCNMFECMWMHGILVFQRFCLI